MRAPAYEAVVVIVLQAEEHARIVGIEDDL